ncbi:MAG: UDP-N-acetylmuramoyl-L-alanine--D-glutamate ligase [Opitutaceae bacterium]
MNEAGSIAQEMMARLARPVAVWGHGRSGRGVCRLLAARGLEAVVYDASDPLADHSTFGPQEAAGHDLVVTSPGFSPDHPWFAVARQAGCECLGEIDFAALFWKGPIVAVTGTNGKTTLTEFLTYALGLAGRQAVAVGNIGSAFTRTAACVTDPETTAVCEVSSFQAETLRILTADWTLWTNFAEDHLERHGTLVDYFRAKQNLVDRTPAGHAFYGPGVLAFSDEHGLGLDPAGLVAAAPEGMGDLAAGTAFQSGPQHGNFVLAAAWWRRQGLPDKVLREALCSFRIGRHRLSQVGSIDGIDFWNDSKATNFHACEAAISTFADPVLWIGGGKSKGGDFEGFVSRIAPRIRHAVLLGETAPLLLGLLAQKGVSARIVGDLDEAVRDCLSRARPGDTVLLSPAFSSLDMFQSYEERGEQFCALVQQQLRQAMSC